MGFWLVPVAMASPRIIDGAETGDTFSEVVAIRGDGLCSAVRIHPQWVLTTAHCFDDTDLSAGPTDKYVFIGSDPSLPGDEFAIDGVHIHPEFVSVGFSPNATSDGELRNDVALVHLAEPSDGPVMRLNDATPHAGWVGSDLTLIGYGPTVPQTGWGARRFGASTLLSVDTVLEVGPGPDGSQSTVFDAGGPGLLADHEGPIQVSVIATHPFDDFTGLHMDVSALLPWMQDVMSDDPIQTADASPMEVACSPEAATALPVTVRCEVFGPNLPALQSVEWTWADGSSETTTSNRIEHVYESEGVRTAEACITWGEPLLRHCVQTAPITACAPPEAAFDAVETAPLVLDVTNTTPSIPECVTATRWSLFDGPSEEDTPLLTSEAWEPALDLTEFGPDAYTLKLDVVGPGGAGAATVDLDLRAGCGCESPPVRTPWSLGLSRRR